MDRERDEGVADGTGMDRPDDVPAVASPDQADEAGDGDRTDVEGLPAIAATHAPFGGGSAHAAGGIGVPMMLDEDDHEPDGRDQGTGSDADATASTESTDPRGY